MPLLKVLFLITISSVSDAAFTGSFDGVLWKGGFETGNPGLKEYSEKVGGKYLPAKTVVVQSDGSMKPRCGSNFLHVKMTGTDKAYDHNRVEIGFHPQKQSPPQETMKDTVRYYGWSMALDSKRSLKSEAGKGDFELAYWEADSVYQQTIGFYMQDGKTLKLRVRRQNERDVGSVTMEEDKWYDLVLGVKWSPQSNDGWVQLWANGKEVVPQTKHATLAWGQPAFSHLGLFFYNPSKTPVQSEVGIYYDCVVYAKGYTPTGECYNDGKECKKGGDNDDGDDNDNDGGARRRRGAPKPPRPPDTRRRAPARRRRKGSKTRRRSGTARRRNSRRRANRRRSEQRRRRR